MRVTFDQCDNVDEVCGLFNKVFDNQAQMEAKIIQNAQEIEALKVVTKEETKTDPNPKKVKVKKPKKKGNKKMKSKGFALTRVLAILMLVVAIAGLGYAAYVPSDITYEIASNPDMLSTYLRDVTNAMESNSYLFTPRAAAPTPASEGMVYYNDGTNRWVGYNGTAWANFDIAGGVTLDGAYDSGGVGSGRTILANDGSVVISNAEADANPVLSVTHSGAADGDGILITISGSSQDAIEIENTGTGYDIEGTGATWYATKGGIIITTASDITGAAGLTLQNDETITNPNGSITFTDTGGNTLIFDLDDGATSIQLDSGDVTTFSFGTVDDLTEIGNITFDQAAAAITLDGNAGGEDLSILQTANGGAADCSIILDSNGTNDTDAIIIRTGNDGGIDIDADEDISITVTSGGAGEDLFITQTGATDSSITITSDGTDDAIKLESTQVTGDIWLDSGDDLIIDVAGLIDLDLVGAFDIDAAGGIDITSSEAADGAVTIETSDAAGNIIITSTDATADAIDIDTTAGGIDIDSASTIAIDNAAGDITINSAAGNLDIDAALAITIDNAGAASDIGIDSAAGSLNLTGGQAAADAVVITSGGGIDIAAVDDVDFILTAGGAGEDFTIQCTGVQDTTLGLYSSGTAANAIEIVTSAGGIDITNVASAAAEDIDISSNRAVNITSSEATDLAILIQTSNAGGNIRIQSADSTDDALDINTTAGGIDVDAAKSIILTSAEGGVDSIQLTSTGGGVDILAATNGDAEDLDLQVTGATNSSIDIYSEGTGADAIRIETTAGGIDIDMAGTAADDDFHITTDSSITFVTTEAVANQFFTDAQGAVAGFAINLGTTDGGITLDADGAANGDITINAVDVVTITSADTDGGGIDIGTTAGANSTIHVHSEAGTTATAIALQADVGGITLLSNGDAAGDIFIDAEDKITLVSTDDHAAAIDISVGVGAAASTIIVTNTSGTAVSLAAAESAAIQLYADAGGIGLNSGLNGANAIRIEEDGGAGGIIMIHANQGTGVAATGEVDASVQIMSDDGGIGLYTTSNLANAIRIEANGGGNETININSVQGTGAASVLVNSVLGGLTLTANAAGKDVDINSVLGSILIEAEEDSATAISIIADGVAASGGVWIQNETGTSITEDTAAIEIQATLGGIQIKSSGNVDDAIVLRADGGAAAEITIHNDAATTVDSIELLSDEGGITLDAGADDAITLTAGTGGVVFTLGQTRKETLDGLGEVVPDGASPPAVIGALGTNAQALLWAWEFEADAGADELVFLNWRVPDGYIVDSARLNIIWSYDTAETDGDAVVFDMTVNAVAPGAAATGGEAYDAGGSAYTEGDTTLTDGDASDNLLIETQFNIDLAAEPIAVGDLVTVMFWVDASESDFAAGVSVDVHVFEIEWESTE